ncbi:phosphatase PAP2 family protein [Saccharomonospora sp. NPDC046836]|uniref:phosphatase PAP2 family protein n=1 Tax=Saccharomonospora sp. NPDC046836 TaxID=3156921 RepID=UPI0033F8A36B
MTTRRTVTLGAVLLAAFIALGLLVRSGPDQLDAFLATAMRDEVHEPAGVVAGVVSAVLGPILPIVLAVGLAVAAAVTWWRGDHARTGVLLRVLALLVVCRATSWATKPLFARERPRVFPDFAYPSGHVVSVASTGFAIVVLCAVLAPHAVTLAARIAVVATLLCAASRIVLNVHWVTDTVGGILAVGGAGLLAAAALRLPPTRGVASSA